MFDLPVATYGLAFTNLIAGSQVQIFEAGTQNIISQTTSSGTSFSWTETGSVSISVDYTILKDGYTPIRVA